MPRRRRHASVRALLAPELGASGVSRARLTGLYPISITVRTRRRDAPATAHAYPARGTPACVSAPVHPVPFRAARRAVLHVPEGALRWAVVSAGELVAEGELTVAAPAALPARRHTVATGAFSSPGAGLADVHFAFGDDVGFAVRGVVVELHLPFPGALRLRRVRAGAFAAKLALPPGCCRYRFRVLPARPVRRDRGVAIAAVGWDFDASYDWGLASHWCEIAVTSRRRSVDEMSAALSVAVPRGAAGVVEENIGMGDSWDDAGSGTKVGGGSLGGGVVTRMSGNAGGAGEGADQSDLPREGCGGKGPGPGIVATDEPHPIVVGSSSGESSPVSVSISNESQRSVRGLRKAASMLSSWRSRSSRSRSRSSGACVSGGRTPPVEEVAPAPAPRPEAVPGCVPATEGSVDRLVNPQSEPLSAPDGFRSWSPLRSRYSEERPTRSHRTRFVVAAGKIIIVALISAAAENLTTRNPASRERSRRSSMES